MTRKGASSAVYKVKYRSKLRGLFSRVENSHTCEKQKYPYSHYKNNIIVNFLG